MINTTITAGLLLRSQMRGFLNAMKMYGHLQDFSEGKSLLESTFYLKGVSPDGVSLLKRVEKQYADRGDRK